MFKIENEQLYTKRVKISEKELYIKHGWNVGKILDTLFIGKEINGKLIKMKITKQIFPKYYIHSIIR